MQIPAVGLHDGQQNAIIDFGNDKNTDVFTHSDEASFEILTKNIMNKKMMPTLVRIEEGGKTNKEQSQGGAEKFIFVLDGHVEINVNNQVFILHKYNTLYFDASLPHHFRNTGKGAAKIGKGSARGIGRLGKKIVHRGNKNKKESDVAD